jgi:hypothetical protein
MGSKEGLSGTVHSGQGREEASSPQMHIEIEGREVRFVMPVISLEDRNFFQSFNSNEKKQIIKKLSALKDQFKLPLEQLFAGTGLGVEVRKLNHEGRQVSEMRLPEELDSTKTARWIEPTKIRLPFPGTNALITFVKSDYDRANPEYFSNLDELPLELQEYREDFLLLTENGIPYPFPLVSRKFQFDR